MDKNKEIRQAQLHKGCKPEMNAHDSDKTHTNRQ